MIASLASEDLPDVLQKDVCIIGGGVAGQTLARRLGEKHLETLIVESGGRDFDSETQALAKGENVGEPYYDLDTARLRLFGGTAAIWGGRCAELDAIDFERRDYIPHSGWPIKKQDLDPYYTEVFKDLGLERPGGEGRLWSLVGRERPSFDPKKLDVDFWVFDENGERFTDLKRNGLERVGILLNATVTEISASDAGEITEIIVKSLNGRSMTIKAKKFVLASGAIETIRLLQGAVPNRPDGLGNAKGQLGRFFMEHPHARGGEVIPEHLAQALTVLPRAIRKDGRRYAAYMHPSPELQREKGILNTSISFAPRRRLGEKLELFRTTTNKLKHDLPSSRVWRSLYHRAKGAAIRGLELTDPWSSVANMKLSGGKLGLFAIVRAEQAPNPDSRVTLGDDVDAFGLPRPVLDWRLSELDKKSVHVLMETLGEEYRRLGWGDVRPSDWLMDETKLWQTDPLISAHPIGGYHHMGGTRMGTTQSESVVNADCRLHESPNLYIASSSVFSTGGWANPTITIMALALRLGDHLARELSEV